MRVKERGRRVLKAYEIDKMPDLCRVCVLDIRTAHAYDIVGGATEDALQLIHAANKAVDHITGVWAPSRLQVN